jgi:transcription antitermination factor NusA-like protein
MTDSKEGTFFVTAADDESAVLQDVADGQVLTLSSNPGVERHEVVTGELAAEPPLGLSWELVSIDSRRAIEVVRSEESPTQFARDLAADQDVGDLTRHEREGTGEIHVITVPEDETETAVDDVIGDSEITIARAARLGVDRVEVRWEPGLVSVRYLP